MGQAFLLGRAGSEGGRVASGTFTIPSGEYPKIWTISNIGFTPSRIFVCKQATGNILDYDRYLAVFVDSVNSIILRINQSRNYYETSQITYSISGDSITITSTTNSGFYPGATYYWTAVDK